jgi:phosphatidylglycerol:prolipoprotein diacylglycerol transferase
LGIVIGMLLGAPGVRAGVRSIAFCRAAATSSRFGIADSPFGAVIGMVTACYVFARRHQCRSAIADTSPSRNARSVLWAHWQFINAELYGRPTDVAWAMVFPTDPLGVPRHPSQLYEAICEGIVLFLLLRALERRALARGWYRPGLLAGAFLVGYGVLRFAIEFTRMPDAQLGIILGPLSMGQLLCIMMVLGSARSRPGLRTTTHVGALHPDS